MLEVCKLVRAESHKVAKNIAKFGKNHQGWHYGFKLHATINFNLIEQLCSLVFTSADQHDAQQLPKLLKNNKTKIVVGDTSYTAQVIRQHIWQTFGTLVLSPPYYEQNKKY